DPHGRTTRSRAASRGTAGRSAMRSVGRSKSKSEVRMTFLYLPLQGGGRREAPSGGEHQGNPTPTAFGGRPSPFRGGISHAPIVALTILSGLLTGSPRLILSTFSMPSITLPQAVYWLSRKRASSKQMKNWLSPEAGLAARAIA